MYVCFLSTDIIFLSTPSARRATQRKHLLHLLCRISIHALREEGDRPYMACARPNINFYPRPPRGGRRRDGLALLCAFQNFYPRPPRGGRPERILIFCPISLISIHALREEGDCLSAAGSNLQYDFYPRPPRGGRLVDILHLSHPLSISIHALREEGDSKNREKIPAFIPL